MLHTVGLIVEYNPLHNGHVHYFKEAKRLSGADTAIAVMSGNFLQRGEPAIVSKWARTEMALHMGADLVLELPVAYAVQPAEWFAYGAVSLLAATGVVTHLCFGTEAGSLDELAPLAGLLAEESRGLKAALAAELAGGASFPAAFTAAAASLAAAEGFPAPAEEARELLLQPNNTLGLHYLIALRRLGSRIAPLTIPRQGAGYHDPAPGEGSIASATAVRRLLETDGGLDSARPYLPAYTAEVLAREFAAGRGPVTWEQFRRPLFHQLLLLSPRQLAQLHEVTEGLEHRIRKVLPELPELSVEALLAALKTKRYTRTKLQRMLVHILLGSLQDDMTPEKLAYGPDHIRVLGFSDEGQKLLKQMKATASLPVVTRTPGFAAEGLARDIKASSIYANALPGAGTFDLLQDYRQPPIRLQAKGQLDS